MSTDAKTASTSPLSLDVRNVRGETVGKVEVDPAELGGKINR